MAQPFEKALVDEGIAGTSLEGLARSIYSQESGGGKNTKTSNAGAVGGMQVIPSTFKSVNPQGDINNPYDNAVAGLRYIKQLHGQSGGDFGLTAAGYYGGPVAMSKAQKGVAVSDPRNPNAPNTLQYSKQVTDRMGKSGATQTKAANPEIQSSIADLGPNYQAAYALMSAPSTDDEDLDNYEKAQQVVAEKEADDTPADFSKAKEMLASVKFESPFASSPAPQDFSEGGEVQHFAPGGVVTRTPRSGAQSSDLGRLSQPVFYNKADKAYLNTAIEQYDAYNAKIDAYNKELDAYKASPDVVKYGQQTDAYNAAVANYNTNVYNPYKSSVDSYNNALTAYQNSSAYTNDVNANTSYNAALERYNATPTYAYREVVSGAGSSVPVGRYAPYGQRSHAQYAIPAGYHFVQGGHPAPYAGDLVKNPFTQVAPTPSFTQTAPGAPAAFTETAPTAPTAFTGKTPDEPAITQDQINTYTQEAQKRAQEAAAQRQFALSVVSNPDRYNLSGFGGGTNINMPSFMAEGGEAVKAGLPETESASMLDKLKKTAGEVVRSAQYAPYDIAGTPVDLVNLGLKGVDYVTGSKLSSEAPVGGSEYLINKANQMGIADKPTGSTTEDLTRMGLGLLSPTAGPRAMVAAGKAVKGTAKAALEDLALASTGQGGSRVAQGAAKALNLEPSFAVAPNSSVSRSMLDEIDPAIQRLLDEPPAKRFVGPKLPERELTSPTGERPFVSTLDKFFEQNNNPVTVEQLVNQLSKSSRDYEMNRLVKLLEGKAPTDKVRPSDLLEQLKETSPARFRMEIKEPDSKNMGQFFASMENPFPSKPMGTVNLLEDLSSKEKLAARYTSDLYGKDMFYYKTANPLFTERDRSKALENLELFFSGPMAKQSAGSDLTSSFKRDVPDIRRLSKKIKEMQMDMSDISFLYKVDRYGFDYSKEHNAIISSVIAKHSEFDKLPINERITKLNEIVEPIIKRDAENHFLSALDKKYGTDMLSHRQALGTSWDSMSGYEKSKVTERMLGDVIGRGLTTAKENLRNLEKPYVDAIEKAYIQAKPYSGQHSSIANENPISFSRFQDITLPTKENVMVIPELQSDRFQSILESGSKGGSQYKDVNELGDLDQKLNSITQKIYSAATPQLRDQLKLEGKKIENRIFKLNERIATGKYNTSEFIPGIEEMPQVMQQLMVKNAISAGIQRGKNGIIFPGPDSAQAQLYEKLPNNLRAVVKDLGKGFEIRKVPLQYEDGSTIDRYGVFWQEDAGKRINKEGVRFNKGGLVGK